MWTRPLFQFYRARGVVVVMGSAYTDVCVGVVTSIGAASTVA